MEQYSDELAKIPGGLMKAERAASILPIDVRKLIQALPLNVVSTPVKTAWGYYFVQVEAHHPPRLKTFEEAKTEARTKASEERTAQVMKGFIDGLKKDLPYEVLIPAAP